MTTIERTPDVSAIDDAEDHTTTIDLVTPSARSEAAPRPSPRPTARGMRIRRVRLRSVATIASVFFVLGYLTVVGSLVVLWNVALGLGYVDTVEDIVTTSLGLDERFMLVGADLFEAVAIGAALAAAFGLVLTVLLALVYNATGALFGGLAVETAPLQRDHRVFSLRHRRFITVRW